jgi:peptidoglycan/LPS O-acetylase OafA/YrhL
VQSRVALPTANPSDNAFGKAHAPSRSCTAHDNSAFAFPSSAGASVSDVTPELDQMRQNNFDALRFLGAVAVLVSHSFPLSYGSKGVQPLKEFSHGQTELGSVAVAMFFIISGFLITKSFDQNPNVIRFLKARVLRIFPALIVVLGLTIIAGAFVTTLPISEYFTNIETVEYLVLGITLRYLEYDLPGVFEGNPSSTVNGSLWTLYFEFIMYLGILLAGVSRTLKRISITLAYAVTWVVSVFLWDHSLADLGVYFLGGAAFYLWRDRIPLSKTLAVLSILALVATLQLGGFQAAAASLGVYLTLFCALSPAVRLPNFARWGDMSYGIYIFAWPVQQLVTLALGSAVTWYWNTALSLPVALALAFASWHLVEKPALSLKNWRRPRMLRGSRATSAAKA